MSKHVAKVSWFRQDDEVFRDNKYSRAHVWEFDGGVIVPASPSPSVVPLPYSVEANVDPEEAFVAALSSCHMLVFLSIAAKKRYVIDEYVDEAEGVLELNGQNKESMTKVILRPKVTFVGENVPSKEVLEKMHHQAHDNCFIANSVKTEVITQIVY